MWLVIKEHGLYDAVVKSYAKNFQTNWFGFETMQNPYYIVTDWLPIPFRNQISLHLKILILSNCVHILYYCFHILGDGRKVTIDVESKTGPEILGIFGKVAGATDL